MTETGVRVIAFTLGDTLRKARIRAGLDQAELAAKMPASRNTVSNYENDHFGPRGPKVMTLRAWATACGVPAEEFESLVRHRGLGPRTRWFEVSGNYVVFAEAAA